MPDERTSPLGDLVMRLMCSATDRDVDAVGKLLEEIGTTYGHDGVFSMCYALSETIRQFVFPQVPRGNGSLDGGDMIAVLAAGELVSRLDAASLWACRFVASYINGDAGTSSSLFYGGLDDQDQTLTNVAALVGMTGDVIRQREQERGHTPTEGEH